MNYDEAVKYIDEIPMFGPVVDGRNKSGNGNLAYILGKLKNPQMNIKAIHIAGTNGKGSTARFIANMLMVRGYKVGVFTSPHLMKINERIAIGIREEKMESMDGRETTDDILIYDISNDDFAECATTVAQAIDEAIKEGYMHLSYFEFLFAMAAVYFDKVGPDYCIYETGLGGRLDATNVLKPVITAITSIGFDHTKYLGSTIKEIVREKAGIIKKGIPVVYNTDNIEADTVIEEVAENVGVDAINVAKTDYIIENITDKTIDFSLHNRYYKYNNMILNVSGATYQVDNVATAVNVCNHIFGSGQYLKEDELQEALDNFYWPGRMEQIFPNVILDGAHNTDAIARFIESVQSCFHDREIRLLFAVAGDKDYEPMIEMLCNELELKEVYVTSINSDRGISSDYIGGLFKMYSARSGKDYQIKVTCDDDIRSAFSMAYYDVKGTDSMLFCVGSLYLIGSIKQIAREVLK